MTEPGLQNRMTMAKNTGRGSRAAHRQVEETTWIKNYPIIGDSMRNWCYSPDLGQTVIHADACPNKGNPDVGNRHCVPKTRKKKSRKW